MSRLPTRPLSEPVVVAEIEAAGATVRTGSDVAAFTADLTDLQHRIEARPWLTTPRVAPNKAELKLLRKSRAYAEHLARTLGAMNDTAHGAAQWAAIGICKQFGVSTGAEEVRDHLANLALSLSRVIGDPRMMVNDLANALAGGKATPKQRSALARVMSIREPAHRVLVPLGIVIETHVANSLRCRNVDGSPAPAQQLGAALALICFGVAVEPTQVRGIWERTLY